MTSSTRRRSARALRLRALLGAVLAASLLLLVVGAPSASAQIFYANFSSLGAADNAGQNGLTLISSPVTNLAGIQVNGSNIYWANDSAAGAGSIAEANLNGSSAHTIITGLNNPDAIALDGNFIYYTEGTTAATWAIGRANLDGTSPNNTFITGANVQNPNGIAVNGTNIFWSNGTTGGFPGNGFIAESDLNGNNQSVLIPSAMTGTTTGGDNGAGFPSGLAIDSNFIYWSERNPGTSPAGQIGEATLAGTNINAAFVDVHTSIGNFGCPQNINLIPSLNLLAWLDENQCSSGTSAYGFVKLNGPSTANPNVPNPPTLYSECPTFTNPNNPVCTDGWITTSGSFVGPTGGNGSDPTASIAGNSLRAVTGSGTCGTSPIQDGVPVNCTFSFQDTDTGSGPSAPTGTVTFTASGTAGTFSFNPTSCTLVPGASNTSSCSGAFTPLKASTSISVDGNYGGDAAHVTSQGGQFGIVVQDPTTTTDNCTSTTSQAKVPWTCTVTVTDTVASPAVPTVPTGTVRWTSSADPTTAFSNSAQCNVVSNGDGKSASCSLTYTPSAQGNPTVTSTWTAPTDFTSPGPGTTILNVGTPPNTTTTGVTCVPSGLPALRATLPTTCTATVTDTGSPVIGSPTGSVTFTSNAPGGSSPVFTPPNPCTLVSNGDGSSSSCSVTYKQSLAGTPTITGTYALTPPNWQGSTGTFSLTVPAPPDRTSTTVSCVPSTFNAHSPSSCTITETDTASPQVTSPAQPPGTVNLATSGTADGASAFSATSCTLVAGAPNNSNCTVTYTPTVSGSPLITATYPNDFPGFGGSTGSQTLTVNPAPAHATATSVACSPTSPPATTGTLCTATVTDQNPTTNSPTGTVDFTSNVDLSSAFSPAASCSLVPTGNNKTSTCSVTYTPSAQGPATVTAALVANASFLASSGQQSLTVLAPPPDTTTTAVACVPSTFPLANSTACTATVTDTHVPSHVPTGNASFASNDAAGSFDSTSCPLVSNGDGKTASCTVNYTAPDVGTPTITASYPGDNVTFTSSSGTTMLTVTTHPTSTAVSCVPAGSGPTDILAVNAQSTCTVTVTDTGALDTTNPTGSVNFTSDDPNGVFDSPSCTLAPNADNLTSSCIVHYTPPDAGTPTITATYVNDPPFAASSGTEMLTVTASTTTTTISCMPAGSGPTDILSAGSPSTCTATVTDTGPNPTVSPTGSVNFTSDDPNGVFDSANCTLSPNGDRLTSSCSVHYTPPTTGTPTITATYVNDPAFDASSGTEMLTVTTSTTTTAINCVPAGTGPTDILSANSQSTCTATVTDTGTAPTVSPTGSVSFSSDDVNGVFDSTTCTLSPNGDSLTSSCAVHYTPPAPGTPTITATYVNDPAFVASSGQEQLTVTSSAATTTVSCTPSTLPAGVSSACTVNVANTNAFGSGPTGTVTVSDGGAGGTFDNTSCLLVDVDTVNSSCTVNYTLDASGTPTITGSYPGDPANGPSSGSEQLTYNSRATTTALSCTPASPQATTSTTCTVTVTDTDLAPTSAPTGVVSFANVGSGSFTPNTNDCTLVDNGDGMSASCTILYTPTVQQTQQLTASYPGDTAHASGSAQIDLVVGFPPPATSSTAVSCTPTSLQAQTTTTCTATVTDTGASPTNPTGTVAFTSSAGGSFQPTSGDCAINPSGTGQSQCSVTFVPSQAGSPTITATFVGNVGFAGSSATQALSVGAAPPDPTSTTVVCVPSSVQVGTSSNCTITVTDTHAATAPTGSVTLSSGRSCTLSATGAAQSSCSIPFEPGSAGSVTLTAAYGGSAAYVASSGQTAVTATPVPPPPAPKKPVPPSNSFSFGTLVIRKSGSDTLQIRVPDAGKIVLVGSGVKTVRLSSRGRSTLTATIVATGSKLRTLKRRRTVVVSLRVTFTPTGGSPRTVSKSVRLRITKRP